MDALIDANVLITYVTGRDDPYKDSAAAVMRLCADGGINGFVAFHTLSILWYVLRRYPDAERREWILSLLDVLTVVGAGNDAVRDAVRREGFKDFEDCLQYECAKNAGARCIITANVKDFTTVRDVKIVTPDEAVALCGGDSATPTA